MRAKNCVDDRNRTLMWFLNLTNLKSFSPFKVSSIFCLYSFVIKDFKEFLSLKNDANNKNELEPLIQWGIDNFEKYGFKVERLDTPELPLLLASKIISKSAKTILIYLQFDGQPVDESEWNQENPYKAELKIYEKPKEFHIKANAF